MSEPQAGRVYVVMGVSGSGKSTVGQVHWRSSSDGPFYDGDDFHPAENVAKMSQGIPLNDDDRTPWLNRLADLIEEHLGRGETAVLACSALKEILPPAAYNGGGQDMGDFCLPQRQLRSHLAAHAAARRPLHEGRDAAQPV